MKTKMKVLMSVVCMCLTISVVYAEKGRVQLNVWGGYKSISMSTFNQGLDNTAAFARALGYPNVSTQKAQGGVIYGVDLDIPVNENLVVGPRIAYFDSNIATLKWNYSFYQTGEDKYNFSLIPITVGVKAKKILVENLSVNYGAYVGYGIAAMRYRYTETYYTASASETVDYKGGSAIVDLTAGAEYMLNENISLGAHCGYMIAKVNEVTAQKDSTVLAVKKGDAFKDSSGTAIPLDFSGLSIAGSLNIKF